MVRFNLCESTAPFADGGQSPVVQSNRRMPGTQPGRDSPVQLLLLCCERLLQALQRLSVGRGLALQLFAEPTQPLLAAGGSSLGLKKEVQVQDKG